MRGVRQGIICTAAAMALAAPILATDSFRADIVYYPPAKFSGVPAWVVAELNARGCRIPQARYFREGPHNLIRGEFVAKGQADWVALCSKDGRSSIVLLSPIKGKCTRPVAAAEDSAYVQQVGSDRVEFSRLISVAKVSEIRRYVQKDSSGVDHEGVIDEFAEKASTIFFCRNGNWMELPAAD